MDFASLPTIIGIIILLAALGLLNPIRRLFTGLGAHVDVFNDVTDRKVKKWDVDSQLNHAKVMNKTMVKAREMEEVHTYEDVMAVLRAKRREED